MLFTLLHLLPSYLVTGHILLYFILILLALILVSHTLHVKLRLTKKVLFHILSYFQPSYQLCLSNRPFKASFHQVQSLDRGFLWNKVFSHYSFFGFLGNVFYQFWFFSCLFPVYELPNRQRVPQRLCVREEGGQFRTRLYQQSKVCHLRLSWGVAQISNYNHLLVESVKSIIII